VSWSLALWNFGVEEQCSGSLRSALAGGVRRVWKRRCLEAKGRGVVHVGLLVCSVELWIQRAGVTAKVRVRRSRSGGAACRVEALSGEWKRRGEAG
jgi:hypothetical protein